MRIYLAGHMPKTGEKDWREEITKEFETIYTIGGMNGVRSDPRVKFLIPTEIHVDDVDTTAHVNMTYFRSDANAARDEIFLNTCDLAVVNLDLNIGKCLGC